MKKIGNYVSKINLHFRNKSFAISCVGHLHCLLCLCAEVLSRLLIVCVAQDLSYITIADPSHKTYMCCNNSLIVIKAVQVQLAPDIIKRDRKKGVDKSEHSAVQVQEDRDLATRSTTNRSLLYSAQHIWYSQRMILEMTANQTH